MAEWLGRGLQSLVQRFDSARRLLDKRTKSAATLRDNVEVLRPVTLRGSIRAIGFTGDDPLARGKTSHSGVTYDTGPSESCRALGRTHLSPIVRRVSSLG